jgi:hypothetical protein
MIDSHQNAGPPSFNTIRRFFSVAALVCIVLYPVCYAIESWECLHPKPDVNKEQLEYKAAMTALLQRHLDQLNAVHPNALAGVYTTTLQTTNCDWFFFCEAIPKPPPPPGNFLDRAATYLSQPDNTPRLFYEPHILGFPIPIPTGHTIAGTPHALLAMAGAVLKTGAWGVSMFLACTVLWVFLMRFLWIHVRLPHVLYIFAILAPYWISIMVEIMQGFAQWVFQLLGSTVGFFAYLAAHVTAIALLLGFRHIARTPAEIVEQVERIR